MASRKQGSARYCYRQDSLKERVSHPNGTTEVYAYHILTNRIVGITHKAGINLISSYAYDYDTNGNRTLQTEFQNGQTRTTKYQDLSGSTPASGYDSLDRLASFVVIAGANTTTTGYTYDGYNRKTEKVSTNGMLKNDKVYSYDGINRLISVNDSVFNHIVTYTNDNNGNTINKNDNGGLRGQVLKYKLFVL